MKNKILDLHQDGDLKTLEPLSERPNILKIVNLTEELPDGLWEMGKKGEKPQDDDPDGDYNIRAMWNRLCVEEPSAMADAQIFEYKSSNTNTNAPSIKQTSLTDRATPNQSIARPENQTTRVIPTGFQVDKESGSRSVTTVDQLMSAQSPRFRSTINSGLA